MSFFDPSLIEEAKHRVDILSYIENATCTKAKKVGKQYFINPCPFCGRRDHFVIRPDERYFKSFSCDHKGDIINFMEQYENLSTADAIQKLMNMAGISSYLSYTGEKNSLTKKNKTKGDVSSMTVEINFNELINHLHRNVEQTDYFRKRGLSENIVKKYKLGYSANGMNDAIQLSTALNERPSDVMKAFKYFLPIWDEDNVCRYFISRVDEQSVPEGKKVNKTHNLKGYRVKLFNERYLKSCNSNLIFVVEGIFDALSIEEFGFYAIALNSVSNADMLMKKIVEQRNSIEDKAFVLIPDNDTSGEKLATFMKKKAEEEGIELRVFHLPSKYKDVNEFLVDDRKGLESFLKEIEKRIKSEWEKHFVAAYLDDFVKEITENSLKPISTGFQELDKVLGGGLVPGLYVLGAATSLGKTAFVQQISDYIASTHIPVLYFSLEMSKKELISRSLSRQTFLISPRKAYTSQDILLGKIPQEVLMEALSNYKIISHNMAIIESPFDSDVLSIRNIVKEYKTKCDRLVVVVDYLQILMSPKGKSLSDKQLVDYNVTQLKKISRDFDVPLIVISSFNRAHYVHSVSFESFKESGGIEYSADVVCGLQFKDIDKAAKNEEARRDLINQWKAKEIRDMELVILKQRNGIGYAKIPFYYQSKFNYYIPAVK